MNFRQLKRRLTESELVGLLQSGALIVTGAVQRIFQDSKDAELCQSLNDYRDRDERELEETVKHFLSSNPLLSPQAYGVPAGRYRASACFGATQAVSLLLKRLRRHGLKSSRPDGRFLLGTYGTVRAADGGLLIPSRSMQIEVARFIQLEYIPKKKRLPGVWPRRYVMSRRGSPKFMSGTPSHSWPG